MKIGLFLVSALGSVAGSSIQGLDVDGFEFIPVNEVYGAITATAQKAYSSQREAIFTEMREKLIAAAKERSKSSRWFGSESGGYATTEYERLRTRDNCVFPIDILILQDATGSFQVDFDVTIEKTLPAIDKVVPVRHPNSRFSLVTYKDKPFNNLGETSDYCLEMHTVNEEAASELRSHYLKTAVGGGRDYPENQYGAIMAVLNSPKTIPWNSNDLASKLIIHITDAQPHFQGDSQQSQYSHFLHEWGSHYDEAKETEYCKEKYYPSPETVKNSILGTQTYLANIIVRPEDPIANPLPAWEWFNSYVGFQSHFTQPLTNEFEGWLEELLRIIEVIENEECVFDETTTPEPQPTTAIVEVPPTKPAVVEPTEPENNCVCPPTNPDCCQKAPEVLIALMKRPERLDIHLVGPEERAA